MNLFLVVVLLFVAVQSADACSCYPAHPQFTFCNTKFALLGKIISKVNLPSTNPFNFDVEYTVQVINRVKKVPKPGNQMKFLTASTGAACGVFYDIGTVQYIQGRVTGSTRRVMLCDQVFNKTPATWSYIYSKGKTNSYIKNCKCKIDEGIGTTNGPSCKMPADNDKKTCYKNQALCVRQSYTSCVWRNNEACDTVLIK